MPLGKTPAEIVKNFCAPGSSYSYARIREEDIRQALKDLLDHAIAEMPKEPGPQPAVENSLLARLGIDQRQYDMFLLGRHQTINDCIAVLNKLKESV